MREVSEGSELRLKGTALEVNRAQLESYALAVPGVQTCQVTIGRPGDKVRLIHALDSIQPVCSASGFGEGAFPGLLSPPTAIANGNDVVTLEGVLVTVVGSIPRVDSSLRQHEAILDFSGPGADLSVLSSQIHVVLELDHDLGLRSEEAATAFRAAGLRVAELLGSAALELPRESFRRARDTVKRNGQVRIAHICEVPAFGTLFDTLVVGRSVVDCLPTPVTLPALDAGAIVSGDYHYASQRNLTYHYQQSPIAEAVSHDLSSEATLEVTILLPVARSHHDKELGAAFAAHLAESYGVHGAVVTGAAAGNAHVDAMFAARECEERGIKAVLSLVEMAGATGADPGMVDTIPEAALIVSTGNREELVDLPPCDTVIGGRALLDDGEAEEIETMPGSELRVPVRMILGSTSQMGPSTLSASTF